MRLSALLLPLALVAACAGPGQSGDTINVVAGFYPLEYAAHRVAGEYATVTNLTSPGVEPHDLELKPRQIATIADADVMVYLRTLQPAVDAAVKEARDAEVVEALGLVSDPRHRDDGTIDPHIWLEPATMAKIGDAVADGLAKADPEHAEQYRANADRLGDDMAKLDTEYHDGLARCELDDVVVSHDAFAYLPAPFTFHSIAGLSPDAEPTPAHLASLHDLIKQTGITTVFTETLATPLLAESLAADLGISTGVLDPVEGLAADSDQDYLSVMRANLDALRTANRCQ